MSLRYGVGSVNPTIVILVPSTWPASSSYRFSPGPPSIRVPATPNTTLLLAAPATPRVRESLPPPRRTTALAEKVTGPGDPPRVAAVRLSSPVPRSIVTGPVNFESDWITTASAPAPVRIRSEEHTSELQSLRHL